MLKSFAFTSLMLVSTFAFAAQKKSIVINDVKAEYSNGGINPAYVGVEISGNARLGSNHCAASAYEIELVKEGNLITPVAVVKEGMENRVCLAVMDDYQATEFTATFVLPRATLEALKVNHVETLDNKVLVSALLDGEVADACEKRVLCPLNYNPATCSYGEFSASGTNSCFASGELDIQLCRAGIDASSVEIKCDSDLGR